MGRISPGRSLAPTLPPMANRERAVDVGAARGRELRQQLPAEARAGRLGAGLTQTEVARAVGMSRSQYSRLERGLAPLDVEVLARLFAVLGMELSVRAYPIGDAVQDAGQLALLDRFRRLCHPSIRWRTEVPMPQPGDRRAWDLVGTGPALRVALDAETRLRDLQGIDRRLRLKQRDSGFERVILLVADTRSNRAVVREHAAWVSERFPMPGRRALELLRAAVEPDEDSLILV
jgi:transcriptional regulator with XRE-family HTH domain